MKLTVAICTWNRCALIKKTLEQITRMAIPVDVDWELLVINNNSTDATPEVLATFEGALPLRVLIEPEAGLSNARNRAVREATGDYILWTDDDVLVDEKWMKAYSSSFQLWPDAAIFGGNIEPWFEGNPPEWLQRGWKHVASAFASRDLGDQAIPLANGVLPFGANFAVRTKELRNYAFDPRLGVRPDSIMGGEETTLIKRMLEDGITGRWVPDARVRHFIPKPRQTIDYVRHYFRGYGEYCAHEGISQTDATIFGAPRWIWREAFVSKAKYRMRRIFSQPEVWVADLVASSQAWGQLQGYRSNKHGSSEQRQVDGISKELI